MIGEGFAYFCRNVLLSFNDDYACITKLTKISCVVTLFAAKQLLFF